MKSEIILQGENKTILLTPENKHEKFFIEKNAILKDSKSFDVEFRFEQRRENSIDGITFNHCIIISNETENIINSERKIAEKKRIEVNMEEFMKPKYEEQSFKPALRIYFITLLIIFSFLIAYCLGLHFSIKN